MMLDIDLLGGGVGLSSKPKVTSSTVGHSWGRVGVSQTVTKSDGEGGVGLFSKPKVTPVMDGP